MFKTLVNSALLSICMFSFQASASLLYAFDFENGLNSTAGNAQLSGTGSIIDGKYQLEALNDTAKDLGIYGLQLASEHTVFTENDYRIEFGIEFDSSRSNESTFAGWKKLIDFSSLRLDSGIYMIHGEEAAHWPIGRANLPTALEENTQHIFAITREALTKEVSIYLDDIFVGSFLDDLDLATTLEGLATTDMKHSALTFFQDDTRNILNPELVVNAQVDFINIFDSLDATVEPDISDVPVSNTFLLFAMGIAFMGMRRQAMS